MIVIDPTLYSYTFRDVPFSKSLLLKEQVIEINIPQQKSKDAALK